MNADVESVVLGDFANSVTMGAIAQAITGGTVADTVAAITGVTSTSDLGTGTNVVTVATGVDISGGTFSATGGTVGFELVGDATMTAAQEALITAATNTNEVTVSNIVSGATTLNAAVESFVLADADNSVTAGDAVQSIELSGGNNTISIAAATTTTKTIINFVGGTDKIALNGGGSAVNASGAAGSGGVGINMMVDTSVSWGDVNVGTIKYAYDSSAGELYYDADGNWGAGSIKIGVIGAGLTATDFLI